MPEIECAGCGRQTNTAVADHLGRKPYDGKAKECYLAWVDGKWVKGCAYERTNPYTKPSIDRMLREQEEKDMYKQVKTVKTITLENGSKCSPIASMESQHGGKAHIIKDDHCYVLVLLIDGKLKTVKHWFREAVEVMRKMGPK